MTEANQSQPNEAYADRNQAAMLAARLAELFGYTVYTWVDPDEPDWPVLCIELPTGQVTWHIPQAEYMNVFALADNHWDGHSVGEKRRRIKAFILEDD